MRSSMEYDCIIIGAGIAGLFAANMLLNRNKKVLLVDRNSFPGGFLSKIDLDGHLLDRTVTYFLGMEDNSPLRKFLNELNLQPQLNFKKVEVIDQYIFPDFEFIVDADYKVLKNNLIDKFPAETDGINQFFEAMRLVYFSFSKLGSIKILEKNQLVNSYLEGSYTEFLEHLFISSEIKAILSARIFGSNVGMLTMLTYLGKIFFAGLFQEITDQNMVDVLYRNLLRNGTEVSLDSAVSTLLTNNKYVDSLYIGDIKLQAKSYVSSMDMTRLMCDHFAPPLPQEICKEVTDKKKSLSSVTLYLVLGKLPNNIIKKRASRIYIFEEYDIKAIYARKEAGEINFKNGLKINIEAIADPDFESKEHYYLRVECDVRYFEINEIKRLSIGNLIINVLVEKLGISKIDIVAQRLFVPADFEKLTGSSKGAGSGWAPSVSSWNTGIQLSEVASNLIQIGCWDKYGSGIFPIYLSAKQVISHIN